MGPTLASGASEELDGEAAVAELWRVQVRSALRGRSSKGWFPMKRWLLFCLGLTGAALAGSLYVWHNDLLPARFPIHWNIHGDPHRWASRDDGLAWPLPPHRM